MAKNDEAKKWAAFRSLMRTLGTGAIAWGVGLLSAGSLVGAVGIVIGFLVLGVKDYIEEKAEED